MHQHLLGHRGGVGGGGAQRIEAKVFFDLGSDGVRYALKSVSSAINAHVDNRASVMKLALGGVGA